MAGTSAYAVPIQMPIKANGPLKTKMSAEAKAYYQDLFSRNEKVELFYDKNGVMYSRITNVDTGDVVERRCEYTDED